MKHAERRVLAVAPEVAIAALRGWQQWLPGLLDVREVGARGPTVELDVRILGPRPIEVRLAVDPLEDGLRYGLVHGDISALQGTIRVAPHEQGCAVEWRQELMIPFAVPGAFMAELDRVLPIWMDGLAAGVSA